MALAQATIANPSLSPQELGLHGHLQVVGNLSTYNVQECLAESRGSLCWFLEASKTGQYPYSYD